MAERLRPTLARAIARAIARAMASSLPVVALAMCFNLGLGLPHALPSAQAKEATPLAENPELEARMLAIASELRCLVCQNQTIAESHAPLALDLRQQIREMLAKGQSDQQVRDFMTQRYGEFILYKPPVRPATALLWFGPGVLALGGLATLWTILKRRASMPPEAFDPDLPNEQDTASNT